MPSITKDEAAKQLIDSHFNLDPSPRKIVRLVSSKENDTDEPIKLLEVMEDSCETGAIDVFYFGAAGDIPFPSAVAMVTPREYDLVQQGKLSLPDGWTLDGCRPHLPPQNHGKD